MKICKRKTLPLIYCHCWKVIVSSTRGIYDRSASLTNECEISCFVFCCQMQLSIVLDTLANNKKPYAADNNQKNKTGQYSVKCQKYFRRIRSNIWFTRCNFVASDTNCFSSLFFCCMQILKALSLHFEVVSPCYTFLTAENENRSISGRFATGRFWRSI